MLLSLKSRLLCKVESESVSLAVTTRGLFLVAESGGCFLVAVLSFLTAAASLAVEHEL